MKGCMEKLAADWPDAYSDAMTLKAARMLLCNEKRVVRFLTWDGIMPPKDGEACEASIEDRAARIS